MLTIILKMLIVAAVVSTQQEEQSHHEVRNGRQFRQNLHPHTFLLTPGLIQARGYPAEIHHVVTKDGYILEMHRIPYSPRRRQQELKSLLLSHRSRRSIENITTISVENASKKSVTHTTKKVVFIQHCVMCSSADFVMNDPDQALAFVMADAGYDVWLGNVRGNVYGRRHVFLSPSQDKFWDFSWDKMAKYDLPAMLAYIRKTTEVDQLNYIGHSMGTSIFFAMMNYHPNINSWIRAMAAMAPVAYMHHKHAPFRAFSPFANGIDIALTRRGQAEIARPTVEKAAFVSALCSPSSYLQILCQLFYAYVGGPNKSKYIDTAYLPVIAAHNPAGSSIHVISHFLQLVKAERFQPFDYGATRNMEEYGMPYPPPFTLSAVTAPIGAFYSDFDWVADKKDVQQALEELPNVVYRHRVQLQDFNHLDFLWGENAGYLVYRHVVQFLDTYN